LCRRNVPHRQHRTMPRFVVVTRHPTRNESAH
jgi:hypothetical protein